MGLGSDAGAPPDASKANKGDTAGMAESAESTADAKDELEAVGVEEKRISRGTDEGEEEEQKLLENIRGGCKGEGSDYRWEQTQTELIVRLDVPDEGGEVSSSPSPFENFKFGTTSIC